MLSESDLVGRDFTVLGMVQGRACADSASGRVSAYAVAVNQARLAAYRLGANAIANIYSSDDAGGLGLTGCPAHVNLVAEAISLAFPDLP